MKHKLVFTIIFLFLTIQIFANEVNIPPMDETFDYYSIEVNNKQSRRIVLADRYNGVYFLDTFKYRSGNYQIDEKKSFYDFYAYENGDLLNREKADKCTVKPYGIVYEYKSGAKSEMMLLEGENGIYLNLKGNPESTFTIAPSILTARTNEELSLEKVSNNIQLIISNNERKGVPYTAVIYPDGTDYQNVFTSDKLPVTDMINYKKNDLFAGLLSGKESQSVIIIFGTEKSSVISRAKEISANFDKTAGDVKAFYYDMIKKCYVKTNNPDFDKAVIWSVISGNTMVNERYKGKGIYAGFPWFMQNWGRDTFIALPGISLVTGRFDDAKDILKGFSDYQSTDPTRNHYGRIPNRVMDKSIIYNTTDGTPWMIREAYEYLQYTDDTEYAEEIFEVAKIAINGVKQRYLDENGFLTHQDADTWMDAKISGTYPWSPRGNRAVEIQALWYNQLIVSARIARITGEDTIAKEWEKMAEKLKYSFNKEFWNFFGQMLFDRIDENGKKDRRIRPNQLMVHTVPFKPLLDDKNSALMVKNTLNTLLLPYGILSLDQLDPYFHPYHEYVMYNKDSAYHNGTIWGWNAGPAVESAVDFGYEDFIFEFTENLTDQILNRGCVGSMSENMDAFPSENNKVRLTGTFSQAWSVSEFARVFYQSYAGIEPQLLSNKIIIKPRFPSKLNKVSMIQSVADGELDIIYSLDGTKKSYSLSHNLDRDITLDFIFTKDNGDELTFSFIMQKDKVYLIESDNDKYYMEGSEIIPKKTREGYKSIMGRLKFNTPKTFLFFHALSTKDYLKNIIMNKIYIY